MSDFERAPQDADGTVPSSAWAPPERSTPSWGHVPETAAGVEGHPHPSWPPAKQRAYPYDARPATDPLATARAPEMRRFHEAQDQVERINSAAATRGERASSETLGRIRQVWRRLTGR
jgi:hypothetical protein